MLTISNYHYIREDFSTPYPSIFGVTPNGFKQQLKLLKNEYESVTPSELLNYTDDILKSKDNYFFVTFDDGLKEQFELALPILDELSIPAVFFANSRNYEEKRMSTVHKIHLLRSKLAPSKLIEEITRFGQTISLSETDAKHAQSVYIYDDKDSAALKYLLNFKMDFKIQEELIATLFDQYFIEDKIVEELYMTENQIVELSKMNYLGSHTHNHFPVGFLKTDETHFELEHSKAFFENLTNTKIEIVAYPYGSPEVCTEKVATIAKDVGYKLGFTTTRGVNTNHNNHLLLNRFDCNDLPGGKNYKKL
ncbi:polysaccharide deacetylase family protein [Flavobacterium sp.]|uniref:polysaccharide deacetylase family protein n=1 Tax=Flavobacterium sp. TaxID=239 RepID=UPI002B4B5FAB|nr:polysaccharide deacetylase family protein [Flavobacterium sp.]HLP63694.1 polysaccharide deacetylase family protein [Flavobacterium sp.]